MQLEGTDQADAELLALVLHKDASAERCLAALSAALKAPRCSALKSAADIVLERFAEDATVPLRLVQALLKTSKDKVDDSTKKERQSMYELLCHHATQHIKSNDYTTCMHFYTAALGYAVVDAKAAVARHLAQAHLALQELDRSLESPDIAAEHQLMNAQHTSLTESQMLLRQTEARKVLKPLRQLFKFKEGCPDMLWALCSRSQLAPSKEIAKQTLSILWDDAIAVASPSKTPGRDALIARSLIRLLTEMEEGKDSMHQELARLFSQAQDRLEAVGKDSFFGPETPLWFASVCWNAAGAAMRATDLAAAAVLFRASGSFHEALPAPTLEDLSTHVDSYLLSARCALEEHPTHKPPLSLLQTLHTKASAALRAATQLPIDPEGLKTLRRTLCQLEMNIALRQGRERQQMLQLIEQAKNEGLFIGDKLVHIGYVCLQNRPSPHLPAAKAAWRAGLQLMLSQGEPQDMDEMAKAFRHLYRFGDDDDEKLTLLKEITEVVRSMDMPPYPSWELEWLIETAWEHGKELVLQEQHAQGLSFMAAALSLMDLCEDYKDHKEGYKRKFEAVAGIINYGETRGIL
ncbi:g2245 [Coccomyxa viridis]|uniref:G2245 protein n=1 Tax=Coccomyxa viridis TaxID=1274662 RepID=A0ABP1FNM6_9CHLO